VATAFPSAGRVLQVKLADTKNAVDAGADEIDMVIDRGAFLAGRTAWSSSRSVRSSRPVGRARLKVILETGELGTYDNVRRASWLALLAGGDFIKTSTGKISPAATLPVTHVMLQAVKDWKAETGSNARSSRPAASAPPRTRSGIWSPCTRSPGPNGSIRTTSGSAPRRC
jgi:deoxyribose-phosphate aldolase